MLPLPDDLKKSTMLAFMEEAGNMTGGLLMGAGIGSVAKIGDVAKAGNRAVDLLNKGVRLVANEAGLLAGAAEAAGGAAAKFKPGEAGGRAAAAFFISAVPTPYLTKLMKAGPDEARDLLVSKGLKVKDLGHQAILQYRDAIVGLTLQKTGTAIYDAATAPTQRQRAPGSSQ